MLYVLSQNLHYLKSDLLASFNVWIAKVIANKVFANKPYCKLVCLVFIVYHMFLMMLLNLYDCGLVQ